MRTIPTIKFNPVLYCSALLQHYLLPKWPATNANSYSSMYRYEEGKFISCLCSSGATQGLKRSYVPSLPCRQLSSITLCYVSVSHAPQGQKLDLVVCCISRPSRVFSSCCMQYLLSANQIENNRTKNILSPLHHLPPNEKLYLPTLLSPSQQGGQSYSSDTTEQHYSLLTTMAKPTWYVSPRVPMT